MHANRAHLGKRAPSARSIALFANGCHGRVPRSRPRLLGQIAARPSQRLLDRLAEAEMLSEPRCEGFSMVPARLRTRVTDTARWYHSMMTTFETLESEVRSYCRAFPAVFPKRVILFVR